MTKDTSANILIFCIRVQIIWLSNWLFILFFFFRESSIKLCENGINNSGIRHSSGNHFVASATWRKQASQDKTLPFKVCDVRRRVFLDVPWLATRLLIKRRTMKHSHSANSISDSRIKYAPSGLPLAHTNIIRVICVPSTTSFINVLYKIARLLTWSDKNNRRSRNINCWRIVEKLSKISITRNNWSLRTADYMQERG